MNVLCLVRGHEFSRLPTLIRSHDPLLAYQERNPRTCERCGKLGPDAPEELQRWLRSMVGEVVHLRANDLGGARRFGELLPVLDAFLAYADEHPELRERVRSYRTARAFKDGLEQGLRREKRG